jgi:ComF family protein
MVVEPDSFCPQCWLSLDFITRPFCNICGRVLPSSIKFDTSCLKCIQNPPEYSLARAIFKFNETSKKLIHNFKYYDKTILAKTFAKNLYTIYKKEIESFDLLVPVPMHKLKRMFRFYNQAFVLAKEISLISGKPVYANVLTKSRWTKAQVALSKKDRDNNLKDSFATNHSGLIKNKKVILVDDVCTTGSTVKACASELKKYAAEVMVLCIAFT